MIRNSRMKFINLLIICGDDMVKAAALEVGRLINMLTKAELSKDVEIACCWRGGRFIKVYICVSDNEQLAIASDLHFESQSKFFKELFGGKF